MNVIKFAPTHCPSYVVATIQNHTACSAQFCGKVMLISTVLYVEKLVWKYGNRYEVVTCTI